MSNSTFLLAQILFCSLSFFFLFHANSQLQNQEQAVLLRLKQFWQSPPSLSHWTSDTSHCQWQEIRCTGNSVTELVIKGKDINGTIPPFICDLKNLTVIDLQLNYIPGEFPRELYNCSKLQHLGLSQNYFVGKIPDDIDKMSRLQFLSLGANNFTGDIPASIGRLQELRELHLHQNLFNGTYPLDIANLSNLEVLYLSFNQFVPTRLPPSFTKFKKLKYFQMAESNLFGEIPEGIQDMEELVELDLSCNALTGRIPSNLFMLKNLTAVYLWKNKLSGEIPQVVQALGLLVIDLSENNLTGPIPDDFGKLEKLRNLTLFSNQLSGVLPEGIGRHPNLIDVRIFRNNLSGSLPPDLGRYSKLEGFQVSENRFTGRLPEHLCAGQALVGVAVFNNDLSGELPESLGNCSTLGSVRVHNNRFSGRIPAGLWMSSSLLDLSNNTFTGELPQQILPKLKRLQLRDNKFSGGIPLGVSSWRSLIVLEASDNLFTGRIPQEITALPSLTTLSLDKNQFSGEIPSDVISWKSLVSLNLSHNQLSGPIPQELGLLPVLNNLDLSENQLSGRIPPQFGAVKFTVLNLSSNNLIGRVPDALENDAYASSILNNPGLCTRNPSLGLKVCNVNTQKIGKLSHHLLAMIITLAIALLVVALLVAFFIIRVHRRRHGYESDWKLTSFHRLDFTEANVLTRLTDSNLIGSGGSGKVYRVPVSSFGHVAVKRIWNTRRIDYRLEKEFLAEVQILGTIRHSNIVKLLCCICNENSQLLVYEYMENRSLDQWLHKKYRPPTSSNPASDVFLDWPKRLQIAVGAAQGLCYMHHDCFPPIIHRDVKSSNILLDYDFKAKIADFGLAKMLINQDRPDTMSTVAGSFGYIAPEYAHTRRVNEKIDVYSFGVILLELVTGREANYGDEDKCLADWAWSHIQEDKPIEDALDKEVVEPSYLDEMTTVFKLGIICTGTLPSSRPTMKEVLQILLRNSRPIFFREKNTGSERDAARLLKNSNSHRMSNV